VASDAHNTRSGRSVCNLLQVVADRFGEEKRAALFQDNRSRPSRGDSCRTFRKSKLIVSAAPQALFFF